MALWLTVGGRRTNAQSHALLSIRQHNGHSKTLNYSLCKINVFSAAQTGWEEGRQGKCPREEEEEEEEGEEMKKEEEAATSISASTPIELFSWLSSRGLEVWPTVTEWLWQLWQPNHHFSLHFVDIFHLQLEEEKKTQKQSREKNLDTLNNTITLCFL